MARADWSTTAQALSNQFADDSDDSPILPVTRSAASPIWSRRSTDAPPSQSRPRTVRDKYVQTISQLLRQWSRLSLLQQAAIAIFGIACLVLTILILIYNERIFHWLAPAAKRWRELPAGWLILWFLTFVVSFPPMIGYSTCVTIAGFVFGMKGWFIMASATVVGSTVSFVVSRTVLRSFVSRMTEKNKQFAALSLVLKHDGLKLLCMIRLCPLPYSFANGAISTIPTVTWPNFMLATAIVSPKLLLHVFIGSRLGEIAENGDKMSASTKAVSYVSILIGVSFGILTGYLIYVRTKARAKVLEAEEAAAATSGRRTSDAAADFIDDPDEQEAVDMLRSRQSDISLHQSAYANGDLERGVVYRDEFTDDEDATERANVFDIGDGEDEDEEEGKKDRQ